MSIKTANLSIRKRIGTSSTGEPIFGHEKCIDGEDNAFEIIFGIYSDKEQTEHNCTYCAHFSRKLEICKGRCAICDFYTPKKVDTQQLITEECRSIEKILLEKNRKYGDSAINPKRIFSKCSAMESINVRMDDKLSRIVSDQLDDEEDPEFDLIGYLILKRVSRKYHGTK